MPRLTYATRKSPLALAQSRAFVERLKAAHPGLELDELQVVTTGDRITDRPLSEVGGKGLFVKEIEQALLERRADIAVHSIKDVPGILPDTLQIACVPLREDARDALVSPKYGTLGKLPSGAKIGTSSLRRGVSIKRARPDVVIVPLRGNVDTRLRKVDAGDCDAIVLAQAGLVRLGLASRATELLSVDLSLPAVGQGALGIECRIDDAATIDLLAAVHAPSTAWCVAAERGVMIALDGDCRTPLAAYAQKVGDSLHLSAFVADLDGSRVRRGQRNVPWPTSEEAARQTGLALGRSLLIAG